MEVRWLSGFFWSEKWSIAKNIGKWKLKLRMTVKLRPL